MINSEYNKALGKVMLDQGILAEEKNYWGGFEHYAEKTYNHISGEPKNRWNYHRLFNRLPKCGEWVELTDLKEIYESEFAGTECDPMTVYLVEAKITCKCGEIKEANLFYEGTMSELLGLVLEQAPKVNYLA